MEFWTLINVDADEESIENEYYPHLKKTSDD